MTKKLLLVEDDVKLAKLVKEYLEGQGFEVKVEGRGDRASARILAELPDLVILDLMLPGMDGLSVCREVRDRFANPILMLTAKGDEIDEVVGLEVGADDYLAKPVRPRLLLARIESLLRRAERMRRLLSQEQMPAEPESPNLEVGPVCLDPQTRTVRCRELPVSLTTAEFDLLHFLMGHAGEVLDRETLYQGVRGISWDGFDRSIDLRIARLRKKLGDDAKKPTLIKSVRGAGYLLAVHK